MWRVLCAWLIGVCMFLFQTPTYGAELVTIDATLGQTIDLNSEVNSIPIEVWDITAEKKLLEQGAGLFRCEDIGSFLVYGHSADYRETKVYLVNVESAVSSLKLKDTELNINPGDTVKLEYDLISKKSGAMIYESGVYWKSSNKAVVSVDENGTITAKTLGSATITAISVDGMKSDSVRVSVSSLYDGVSMNIGADTINIYAGGTRQLGLYRKPGNEEVDNPSWSSINSEIVSVENGLVIGEKVGETSIFAYDPITGHHESIRVRVNTLVKDFSMEETLIRLNDNKTAYQIHYNLIPRYEETEIINKEIIWTSTNDAVASVDENGVVYAKSSGVVKITGKSADGDYEDVCSVEVNLNGVQTESDENSIKGVSIGTVPYYIQTGTTVKIQLENLSETFNFSNLKTFVQDGPSSQIEVREDGVYLTPVVHGRNKILLKDFNGNQLEMVFFGRSYLNSVEVDEDTLPVMKDGLPTIFLGQSWELGYILNPAHGYTMDDIFVKTVTWKSSDPDIAYFDEGKLIAVSEGEFEVTLTSDDGLRTDTLEMQVLPMVISIDVASPVMLDIGEVFTPEITYKVSGGYEKPFEKGRTYEVISQQVDEDYLKLELGYEKEMEEILESVDLSDQYYVQTKNAHRIRRQQLEKMISNTSQGYATVLSGFKNRAGEVLNVVNIDNSGYVLGANDGKAVVRLTTVDGAATDNITIIVK